MRWLSPWISINLHVGAYLPINNLLRSLQSLLSLCGLTFEQALEHSRNCWFRESVFAHQCVVSSMLRARSIRLSYRWTTGTIYRALAVNAVNVAVSGFELVDLGLSRHSRVAAIQLGSDLASTSSKPLVIQEAFGEASNVVSILRWLILLRQSCRQAPSPQVSPC
jgi:hypothetical protein